MKNVSKIIILLAFTLICLAEVGLGQDRIIKTDGSLIEGDIVRITENVLEYRLSESQGPLFEISLSTVHKIILESGDSIEYNPLRSRPQAVEDEPQAAAESEEYEENIPISREEPTQKPSGRSSSILSNSESTITASVTGVGTFVDFSSDDSSNDIVDYKSKFGIAVNVRYTRPLQNDLKISLDAGLLRASWYAEDNLSSGKFEFDATYLTLQPTLQKSFDGILVRGGVFYDYGLSGTNKTASGAEFKIFKDEALNRTNAGLVFGAGFDVTEFTQNFFDNLWGTNDDFFFEVILDYRLGLTDVEGRSDSDNQKARLSFLSIGAHFSI